MIMQQLHVSQYFHLFVYPNLQGWFWRTFAVSSHRRRLATSRRHVFRIRLRQTGLSRCVHQDTVLSALDQQDNRRQQWWRAMKFVRVNTNDVNMLLYSVSVMQFLDLYIVYLTCIVYCMLTCIAYRTFIYFIS